MNYTRSFSTTEVTISVGDRQFTAFYGERVNIAQARQKCVTKKQRLATIRCKEELLAVRYVIKSIMLYSQKPLYQAVR